MAWLSVHFFFSFLFLLSQPASQGEKRGLFCGHSRRKMDTAVCHIDGLLAKQLCRPPPRLSEPHSTGLSAAERFAPAIEGAGRGNDTCCMRQHPENQGGCDLHGPLHVRRFATMASMGLKRWSDAWILVRVMLGGYMAGLWHVFSTNNFSLHMLQHKAVTLTVLNLKNLVHT
jgi:hypothetical protein